MLEGTALRVITIAQNRVGTGAVQMRSRCHPGDWGVRATGPVDQRRSGLQVHIIYIRLANTFLLSAGRLLPHKQSAPQAQIAMLRQVALSLPSSLRVTSQLVIQRHFAEGFTTSDPKLFKKFIGVEDNLGAGPDARGKLNGLLNELLDALKVLPESSDYRRAVEATAKYRLKVLELNDSDLAAEEVLDSHLEEIILECNEELALLPIMTGVVAMHACSLTQHGVASPGSCALHAMPCRPAGVLRPHNPTVLPNALPCADTKPWDVPEDHQVSMQTGAAPACCAPNGAAAAFVA